MGCNEKCISIKLSNLTFNEVVAENDRLGFIA